MLAGCGGKTTPVGIFKSVDLRIHLPSDVAARAPADNDTARISLHEAKAQLGDPATTVAVRWRAFKAGSVSGEIRADGTWQSR